MGNSSISVDNKRSAVRKTSIDIYEAKSSNTVAKRIVNLLDILRTVQTYIIAIGLFYAAIIFVPSLSNSYILPKLTLLYIAASCLLLTEAVIVITGQKKYLFYLSDIFLGALLTVQSIACIFSTNRLISFYGNYQQEGLGYISVLSYCIIAYIFVRLKKYNQRIILLFFIGASTLSSLYTTFMFVNGSTRPSGLEGQPILSSIIIALGFLFITTFWNVRERDRNLTMILSLLLLLHAIAIFILQSSSSMISLLLALLALTVVKHLKIRAKISALFIVILISATVLLGYYFYPQKTFSISQRSQEYSSVFKMLLSTKSPQNLLVGYGQNTSGYGYKIYRNAALNLTKERSWDLGKIRNHYLELLYTTGLLGSIIWIGFILYLFAQEIQPYSVVVYFLIIWQFIYYLTPIAYVFFLGGICLTLHRVTVFSLTLLRKRSLFAIFFSGLAVFYTYTSTAMLSADFEIHRGNITRAINIFPYYSEYHYKNTYFLYDKIFHYRLTTPCIAERRCSSGYLATLYDKANTAAEQTTNLNPSESRYWDIRATLLFFKALDSPGEHDQLLNKALEFHTLAFAIDPTNYNIADNIGSVFMEMGDYANAKLYFAKSLQLYPDYIPAKNHYSEIIKKLDI